MEVILLERVAKLGAMGEIVKVRPGFARNYLIPQGKALRATEEARKNFEASRAQLEADNQARREEAEFRATEVDGLSVVVLRQASESSQLYGSVSARDIVEAFDATGVKFLRSQVRLPQAIKILGIHEVTVALHPEVEISVRVNIARSQEEADIQAGLIDAPPPEEDEPDDLDNDLRDLAAFGAED